MSRLGHFPERLPVLQRGKRMSTPFSASMLPLAWPQCFNRSSRPWHEMMLADPFSAGSAAACGCLSGFSQILRELCFGRGVTSRAQGQRVETSRLQLLFVVSDTWQQVCTASVVVMPVGEHTCRIAWRMSASLRDEALKRHCRARSA